MLKKSLIYLDTAAFSLFLQGNDEVSRYIKNILIKVVKGEYHAVTSIITKLEIFSSINPQKNQTHIIRYNDFFRNLKYLSAINIDENLVSLVSEFKQKYSLSLNESIHVATAIQSKADYYISDSNKIKNITEVHVLGYHQL